jgi:hypothetical protein
MRFKYEFEELPLITENGIQAALINGAAIIDADVVDRIWDVHQIDLEGFDGMKRITLPLDYAKFQWLWFAICDALERAPFCNHIMRRLDDELIGAGEEAAERRAEARRDA